MRIRKHVLAVAAAWLSSLCLLAVGASGAEIAEVKTVYLLPMSNGLDQYLASQLTTRSVMQVVADPTKADAIFTDHIGPSLEQSLTDLYGEKSDDTAASTPDDKTDGSKAFARSGMQGQRGRGTVFLVDRKSRAVLWSDFEQPKYPTPDGMRHVAGQIAGKLARTLKGK